MVLLHLHVLKTGNATNHSYPRSTLNLVGDSGNTSNNISNIVYNPTTGYMTITHSTAHGLQNGNRITNSKQFFDIYM